MRYLLDAATAAGLIIFALGALAALVASALYIVGKISDLLGTSRLLLAGVSLVVKDRDRVRKQRAKIWTDES